jgi:hypothetical protein
LHDLQSPTTKKKKIAHVSLARRNQGFKNRLHLKNRSPLVLPKTAKTGKPVSFYTKFNFQNLGKETQKQGCFPVYRSIFGRFLFQISNFECKTVN